MKKIKINFVPGLQLVGGAVDNSPAAIGQRCTDVAEHFRIEAVIEDRIGRPAMAADFLTLSAAYGASADVVLAVVDGAYRGPGDRSPGWWGRAMAHKYGPNDATWPAFELRADHPGRATAPADAVFRMPD